MVQDNEKRQNTTTYEIEDKKYTVITRSIENVHDTDKLYDIICKYAISQINANLNNI